MPNQTNVLQHDINVDGAHPIKQHAYHLNAVKRTASGGELLDGEWSSQA